LEDSLEQFYIQRRDYMKTVEWQIELRKLGSPIPAVDLIIAAQAYSRDLTNPVTKDIKLTAELT